MSQPFILFVPGIKGSELYEGDNKRWFPKKNDDLIAMSINNELQPGRPLGVVNAFGIFKVQVYKPLLDFFEPSNFDFFSYDWRQPLQDTVDLLVKRIIGLSQKYTNVILLAHSMGGILSKLAINNLDSLGFKDLIKKFITIGTPWHGSVDAYKSLAFGEPGIFDGLNAFFGFLDDKKTRQLAIQFPSAYQLLPSRYYYEQLDEGKFLLANDNREITYEEFIIKVQGFFNETIRGDENSINIWEKYMKPIQESMALDLPEYIDHDCLIGCQVPTIYRLPFEVQKARIPFKQDCEFENGDGVVPIISATPKHSANLFYCTGEHTSLCASNDVLDFIKWSIDGKINKCPLGISLEPQNEMLRRSVKAKIMCPVDSTILDSENKYVAGVFDPNIEEVSPLAKNNSVLYYSIGEAKYVFFKENVNEDIYLKINSYDMGVADISVKYYKNDEEIEQVFEPIPVSDEISATLLIPLSNKEDKAELEVNKMKKDPVVIKKKERLTQPINLPAIPKLKVKVSNYGDKIKYRSVYSGSIELYITSNNSEIMDGIYYQVDDKIPSKYDSKVELLLESGKHVIKAFGKDIYNRPTPVTEYSFTIDNNEPETAIDVSINPDGLNLKFIPITNGSNATTYYRVGQGNFNEIDSSSEANLKITDLAVDPNRFMEIEYFSENEFGKIESPRKFTFGLGNIPILMWEEFSSAANPEMIWNNLFRNTELNIYEFDIYLLEKGLIKATPNSNIGDNVRGVSFKSRLVNIEVRYAEKYSLYFEGAPTEVLEVGQTYKFSFQLLTERSKEQITNTKPRAKLRAVGRGTANLPDKSISLDISDGIFYGSFTVDENFLKYKYKIIITDIKNTIPPLREIPLIMKEED
ncbi:lipase/acyltransferase domain-containing protein [Paenibacillus rubinfantis]|uniref:lipase/acyltransferase domain-containing protein n=1 Tax=Paenibacillus rubinfantis TaxID=1720296 RepID=UPI00073FA428|nr:alpha/beta hydrolase [Paenibacillus rubinfantis]